MAGTCTITTNVCVPFWQCEPGQTGWEIDGCGNRRENPAACTPVQTGSASFTSNPPGAEIYIDGADQGVKTPNTVTNMSVGTHTYTLKLAGYNDYTGVVLVEENMTAQVSATPTILEGCIYFNTTLAGARIFIDNADTGQVTPLLLCGLTLGSHTYRLSLTGYKDITGNVNLAAGQGTTVTGTLPKKGIGTGTIIGIGLLGAGVLGAVVYATKK